MRSIIDDLQIEDMSTKPPGFYNYWTCVGDDPNNPTKYGTGDCTLHKHTAGDPTTQHIKYIDFNCVENVTFIHEGYFSWLNCFGDIATLELVTSTVSGIAASDTLFNVYDNVVVPANNDGNYQVTSDITRSSGGLVYMPINEDGSRSPAFWNATWDTDSKVFKDISPAPLGDGEYNMFTEEVILTRFINKIHLLGDGSQNLRSANADEIGNGMRVKVTLETYSDTDFGGDHDWYFTCFLALHREKTV